MSYRRALILSCVLAAALLLFTVPTVAFGVPGYSTQWGVSGGSDGDMVTPWGVAVNGLGTVYVADFGNGRVQYFNSTGSFQGKWNNDGAGTFTSPDAITVDRFGQVVVADFGKNRVNVFSANGTFVRKVGLGATGAGDGQFITPGGVAVDRFGFIYVAEAGNNRVQKFKPDGTFLLKWGSAGTDPGKFSQASGIAVDPLGYVYVAEWVGNRVQKFTSDGVFVQQWGSGGTGNGQFNHCMAVTVGQDGNIYVVDSGGNRVQAFTPKGDFLFAWGTLGSGNNQFSGPRGVASDGTGIYVADAVNNRIEKFTLTSAKMTTRIGGADRYAVAVGLAGSRWPGYVGIKDVIVVCGEDRANADPLASAGLAGIYDAPVLITKSNLLPSVTSNALKAMKSANGPLSIHVIGGTTSVPKSIYNQIAATNVGGTIERISGADRYELSANMATRLKGVCDAKGIPVTGVMLFNGQNPKAFYDALAASPLSAGGQAPMLALRNTSVPGSVKNVLNGPLAGKPRVVVNSTAYVPASLYTAAGAAGRLTTSSDRATAAVQIAAWGRVFGWVGLRNVAIANKLPDALTGGSYIGEQGGFLLYTDLNSLPKATQNAIPVVKIGSQQGWVFGGPASVSNAAIANFNTLLNTP